MDDGKLLSESTTPVEERTSDLCLRIFPKYCAGFPSLH